ncbi:hypothetical protein SAMN05216174_106360 [Actinokineospora iranica]|uniref:PH domain-containing protein n=2 Tax=Actinokineospora iranica TaxID=1271860 RepID=A0A1G6RIF2_9PSEU|nr:hypothetical protein SAMN05216174_106360 [Actinokineospora iranica]
MRWNHVLGNAIMTAVFALALLLGAFYLYKGGFDDLNVAGFVVLAVVPGAFVGTFLRRWKLVVGPETVVVRREALITLRWSDFQEVKAVSRNRDRLVFTTGDVESANPLTPLTKRVTARLRKSGADQSVDLVLFFRDWRKSDLPEILGQARQG